MLVRMAAVEFVRLCGRRRLWLLVAVGSAYGAVAAWLEVEGVARGALVQPGKGLYLALSMQSLWLLVLFLPLGAGGTLARDFRLGYLALLRSRGATTPTIVSSKLFAAGAVALASFSIAGAAALVVTSIWGGGFSSWAAVGTAVSFLPRLLEQAPALWVAVVSSIYVAAGAAMLALGVAVAGVSASRFLSEIGPPLIVLIAGFGMTGPLWPLNPLERASFLQISGVGWTAPVPMLVYWLAVSAGCTVLALLGWRRGSGGRT